MTAYVDASVILRVVMGQAGRLEEWPAIERPLTSALAWVECDRTLDRARLANIASPEALGACAHALHRLERSFHGIRLDEAVLARARQPFSVPVGSLDAIHLASALLWAEAHPAGDCVFATHDLALANAARSMGLAVLGA